MHALRADDAAVRAVHRQFDDVGVQRGAVRLEAGFLLLHGQAGAHDPFVLPVVALREFRRMQVEHRLAQDIRRRQVFHAAEF